MMTVLFVEAKSTAKRATRETERCHEAGSRIVAPLLWKFVLDLLTSVDSELRNRILHSPSVLVEQIPYARCFQYQTFATFSVVILFEVRQERFSSSTDIRLFMKRLNHS